MQSGSFSVLFVSTEKLCSGSGLAQDERCVYLAGSGSAGSQLLIFDKATMSLESKISLTAVSDIHSICLDQQSIIAASTGSDEVLRVRLDRPDLAEVLWRASDRRRDTHHINSIAWVGDRLFCSAFGPKQNEHWHSARQGYVRDVSGGVFVLRGIYHPHSIVTCDGEIFVCESSTSTIVSRSGSRKVLTGYLRGLTFDPNGSAYVGSSIGRTTTDRPGETLNPADVGESTGRCAVSVIPPAASIDASIVDLSQFGAEIYDLIWLEAPSHH